MKEINKKINVLTKLCKSHNVKQLYAFGSVVRDDFDLKNSDVDLIVDLNYDNPIEKGEHLMQFWTELELLFNRKVDLLTTKKIKNLILNAEIEKTKKLVYEQQFA